MYDKDDSMYVSGALGLSYLPKNLKINKNRSPE